MKSLHDRRRVRLARAGLLCLTAGLFAACTSLADSVRLYVAASDGSDLSEDASEMQPLATIAEAVRRATGTEATITLLPGRHTVTATVVVPSGVTVSGSTGDWRDVVIDGEGANRICFNVKYATATVRDLTVSNFLYTSGSGSGITLSAGTVANCRITACLGKRSGSGSAVVNSGGSIIGCVIDGNTCSGNIYHGIGYYQSGNAALADGCVITNNTYSLAHGNGAEPGAVIAGGTMRNCLIADNVMGKYNEGGTTPTASLGLRVSGANTLVSRCAIVRNRALVNAAAEGHFAGLVVNSGTVEDCVIQDNFDGFGVPVDVTGAGAATTGAAATDYDYDLTADGFKLRPGTEADVGPASAKTYDGLYADISVRPRVVTPGTTVSFAAGIANAPTGATCSWRIVNERTGEVLTGSGESFAQALPAGVWRASLEIVSGDRAVFRKTDRRTVNVFPDVVYVDPRNAAGAAYPYRTRETAATSLHDVIAQQHDGLQVRVAAGTTQTLTNRLALWTDTEIVGEGSPSDTSVSAGGKSRVLYIANCAAKVSNLTLCDGKDAVSTGNMADIPKQIGGGAIAWLDRGGIVSNCVLTRASNASRTFSGLGAFICGGTMTHCVLHTFTPQNDCGYGYAVRVRNGGLLSHCVVSNAYTGTQKQHQSTQKSAVVLVDGGEVRNCLIVDNHVKHASRTAGNRYVGGVSLLDADSRLVSSTVIGNSVNLTDDLAVGGVAAFGGATVKNCLIVDNENGTKSMDTGGDGTGVWSHNATDDAESLSGAGNVLLPSPLFKEGTYELRPRSPLLGTAEVELWMHGATDLNGDPRLRNDSVADPGAFAYQLPPIGGEIRSRGGVTVAMERLETVLTVDLEGNTQGATYRWTCDGSDVVLGTERTLEVRLDEYGIHLYKVEFANAEGASGEATIELTVAPKTVYVKQVNDGAAFPYGTPGTAATNVLDAMAAAVSGATVVVDDGCYRLTQTLEIDRAMTVVSANGPERTTLWSGGRFRAVDCSCEGALFSGFAVSNGYVTADAYNGNGVGGANLLVRNGAVAENCLLLRASRDCVRMSGGHGAGVVNGTLRDSVVSNLYYDATDSILGLGLVVDGSDSVVTNCRIVCNYLGKIHRSNDCVAGVVLKNGLMTHCLVAGNRMQDGVGSNDAGVTGVYVKGGEMVNCTVVTNVSGKGPAGVRLTGGMVRNCLIWGNCGENGLANVLCTAANETKFSYTRSSPLLTGTGCIDGDPLFKDVENNVWNYSAFSPCARAGECHAYLGWVAPPRRGLMLMVK